MTHPLATLLWLRVPANAKLGGYIPAAALMGWPSAKKRHARAERERCARAVALRHAAVRR